MTATYRDHIETLIRCTRHASAVADEIERQLADDDGRKPKPATMTPSASGMIGNGIIARLNSILAASGKHTFSLQYNADGSYSCRSRSNHEWVEYEDCVEAAASAVDICWSRNLISALDRQFALYGSR